MFYAWDITIPAGRAENNPVEQMLKLTKGVITKCDLTFPAGCHGLVKVRIRRWEHQLIPLSSDEWVTGDNATIQTEAYYEFEDTPSQLKFVGCSPDCKYPHTITVRIQVLPRAVASMLPFMDLMAKFFRRIGFVD